MRVSTSVTVTRVFLGLIFMTYGIVKVLGGQYYYGPWVMDKATVDGPSLVWAFFGYSQVYGRATGLFELGPAILILIPRTATIGAAALFAVSLNITIMDFAYGYPSVKYLALFYTVLLAWLLWVDRHKILLLLESNERARAALGMIAAGAVGERESMSPKARRILLVAAGLFVIGALNLLASSLSGIPHAEAQSIVERASPGATVRQIRSRVGGLIGVRWMFTLDYEVSQAGNVDTMTVIARKTTGFLPWRIGNPEPADVAPQTDR
ncbi:MAG: hypothetical protein ACT4OZ_16370 [Gemmatimonadota bacterium]